MANEQAAQAINGTAWTNVDIAGSVTEDSSYRIQDDFHAAVNADWLKTAEIQPGNSSESAFWERIREVQAQVEELLADETVAGHEADLVHQLYGTLMDMETRNELGISPIMPLVERISAVNTLEDLTALLTSKECALAKTFLSAESFADKKDSLNNVVYLDRAGLTLSDADEYRQMTEQGKRMREADRRYHVDMLQRVGLAQDAAQKADDLLFELETQIAQACFGMKDHARDDFEEITYNPRTAAELQEQSPNYPVMGILAWKGLARSKLFILGEPEWLKRIDELYVQNNVEAFKAAMLISVIRTFGNLLDQQAYDRTEQWKNERMGSVGSKPLDRSAYDYCNNLLGMAVGKMYIDRFFPASTKKRTEELIAEVLKTYHERLASAKWLSQQTREKACEKLDALTARVGYPKSWPDYKKLQLQEGANLVQIVSAIAEFERMRDSSKVNQSVDREEWYMNPHEVNAYYLPTDNSINIPAGILGGVFFADGATREEVMGGIGVIIGHEITHAFDKNGSLYDKDGNLGNSWWTDEDRAEFKKRTDAVAAYWNGIECVPGINVNGDLCVTEIVADLGGMCCMTQIGHGYDGFDFADMFKAYARVWRTQESQQLAEYLLANDVHAPAHLRTNGTVQMLDEFQEAFGIQPGDGMWLDAGMRLKIW